MMVILQKKFHRLNPSLYGLTSSYTHNLGVPLRKANPSGRLVNRVDISRP